MVAMFLDDLVEILGWGVTVSDAELIDSVIAQIRTALLTRLK
jgi:hypothetical protein